MNVERDGLPTDGETALPVSRGEVILGHFWLNAADAIARPSPEQLKVAVLLADQVAAVLADPVSQRQVNGPSETPSQSVG